MFKRRDGNDLIAIDLTTERVKFVHAKELSGALVIHHVRQKEFTEGADDKISAFLADCYRELKIKKRHALCVIPSKLFITKNIDVPSNDKDEIGKIVDLQAGRLTPYSRDEIIIDYISTAVPDQYYTNVLLTILNRKIAERYFSIFDHAKIEVDRIAIASEGISMTYDRVMESHSEDAAIGGIHIGEDFSELTALDSHQMVFIRVIPVGAKHFRENRETAHNDFMIELNKSIIAYQNLGVGKPLKSFILAGLIDDLDFLEKEMPESIPYIFAGNLPVKMVDYKSHFTLNEEAREAIGASKEVSYFETMACLSAGSKLKINLVPNDIMLKLKVRKNAREMFVLGNLIMAIALLFVIYYASKLYLKDSLIKKLDEHDRATFSEARTLEMISTKRRIVRNIIENQGRGLYIFEKLTSLIGSDIYLTGFSFDNEKSYIRFSGTANSMSRVFAFVTELEESNYFSSVKASKTKSRREGSKDVADFEMECILAEGL